MTEKHNHRDFRCAECGELVTCLSCLEIHAASLPRGPAFSEAYTPPTPPAVPPFQPISINIDYAQSHDQSAVASPPLSLNAFQQPLFA